MIDLKKDLEAVREEVRRSPATARVIAIRTDMTYKRALAALNTLKGNGEADWTAQHYDQHSYARVWGPTP